MVDGQLKLPVYNGQINYIVNCIITIAEEVLNYSVNT